MAKKLKFFLFFLLLPFFAFAYSDKTTHPALTDEIVDFYNLIHPEKPLGLKEKEWLIEGSQLEDIWPRPVNHFYDPTYKVGWTGRGIPHISPSLAYYSVVWAGLSGQPILSALEWATNPFYQQKYKYYGGDRTWQKALIYYAEGNFEEAYRTLGFLLHLLEDMGVPEHTRDDGHADFPIFDDASPYEEYTARWNRDNLIISPELIKFGYKPIQKNSFGEYLISLAEYSNHYFFSKDTITDSRYSFPRISDCDKNFCYGRDEENKKFLLITVEKFSASEKDTSKLYRLGKSEEFYPIFNDYFFRLSRQIILHGAGVLELFQRKAEEFAIKKEFPEHLIVYDTSKLNPPFISLAGEAHKAYQKINEFLGTILKTEKEEQRETVSFNFSEETTPEINFSSEITTQEIDREISFSPSFSPEIIPTPSFILSPTPVPLSPFPSPSVTLTPSPSPLISLYSSPSPTLSLLPTPSSYCSFESSSASSSVIFNEIAWMGTKESANYEWIELKNISSEPIDLFGWQLLDKNGQIKIIFGQKGEKTLLLPNEFYLLERSTDEAVPHLLADLIFTGAINDADESLRLFNKNCELVDKAETNIDGNWPAGDKIERRSMERRSDLSWQTYQGNGSDGIFGTPKAENSQSQENFQENSQTFSSGKILISEFFYDAEGSDEGKEFIELYNPNDFVVDLTNWQIKLVTEKENISLGKITPQENHFIQPHSFYLIGFNNYNSQIYGVEADLIRNSYSLPQQKGVVYHLQLFDSQKNLIDEVSYQGGEAINQSFERKAQGTSTAESMVFGEDRFLGNGYDSDSMTDFIFRSPQPQNSLSLPEPRLKPPSASNFTYQITAEELILSFQLLNSNNYPFNFELKISNNPADFTEQNWSNLPSLNFEILSFQGTNYQLKLPILEVGTHYLAIKTYDQEGLASEISEIFPLIIPSSEILSPQLIYQQLTFDNSEIHYLSNWEKPSFAVIFRAQESGFLRTTRAFVRYWNCPMPLRAKVYLLEPNEESGLPQVLLASSLNAPIGDDNFSYGDSFLLFRQISWYFDETTILWKNHYYALLIESENLESNCIAYFTGLPNFNESRIYIKRWGEWQLVSLDDLALKVEGSKTRLEELDQIFHNASLIEGETIFNLPIVFQARVFSIDNQPVKLQIEISQSPQFTGQTSIFESDFVSSGQVVKIYLSRLSQGIYYWRARVIDPYGNASFWYNFGSINDPDFYLVLEKNYPANIIYHQPISEKITLSLANWNYERAPLKVALIFLSQQSGWLDYLKLRGQYYLCTPPVKVSVYSVEPNQVNGLPSQLLTEGEEERIETPYFNFANYYSTPLNFFWQFPQSIFLEENHYYALVFEIADRSGGNCFVHFFGNGDLNNSRIYSEKYGKWHFLTHEDIFIELKRKQNESESE